MFDSSVVGKLVLGVLVVCSLAFVGAVDFTAEYEFDERFSVEEVSGDVDRDSIDPIVFDELSNGERNVVLEELNGGGADGDELSERFGREGYLSINGQLYVYELTPSVQESVKLGELLVSVFVFVVSFGVVIGLSKLLVSDETSARRAGVVAVCLVLLFSVVPVSQFLMFSEFGSDRGKVTYLGSVGEVDGATEFSSLSDKQQAYVATLTAQVSEDGWEREGGYTVKYDSPPVSMTTNMSGEELRELDAVVMRVDGEVRYYNFVTTEVDENGFGLTSFQTLLMQVIGLISLLCSLFIVVSVFEESGFLSTDG